MGSSGKSEQMKYTENTVMNMSMTTHPGDVPGVEPNPGGECFCTNQSTSPLALSLHSLPNVAMQQRLALLKAVWSPISGKYVTYSK
jgi:hypothetical protein